MTNRRGAHCLAALAGILLIALAAIAAAADEPDMPVLGPKKLQRMTPSELERNSRDYERQRLTKPRDRVKKLIDQAVADHAKGGVVVPEDESIFEQLVSDEQFAEMSKSPAPEGFQAWKLGENSELKWELHGSAALEDFVDKRWHDYLNAQWAERERLIEQGEFLASYAGPYLNDPDPGHRAVACEFLSHFPLEVIHQGLLRQIADLMRDKAVAFKGTQLVKELPPEDERRYSLGEATVGEIAKLSLQSIFRIQFQSVETFERWWKDNSDYRERLWYWHVRAHNFASGGPLETMKPELALKLMLLAGVDSATEAEALASWPPSERAGAKPPLKIQYCGGSLHPSNLTDFVRIHRLQGELIRIAQHEVDWPVIPDYRVLSAVSHLLVLPDDLPPLLKLLEDSKGALAPSRTKEPHWSVGEVVTDRTKLVRLAVEIAPDRAEEILVAELNRAAGGCLPAVDLMAISGLKHWDIVKTAALRDTFRGNLRTLITALEKMHTPAARHDLGDLLESLHLDAFEQPRYQHDAAMAVHALLGDFAAAAAAFNDGPVVSDELLERAKVLNSSKGKGARPIPEEVAHNKKIPEARREIAKQLGEYFARKQ